MEAALTQTRPNAFECLSSRVVDAGHLGHRAEVEAALNEWSNADLSIDVSDWNPDDAAEGLIGLELLERRVLAMKAQLVTRLKA